METVIVQFLNFVTRLLNRWRNPTPPGPLDWEIGTSLRATVCKWVERVAIAFQATATHVYVLGGSGGGKSRFLTLVFRQHVRRGEGIAVIDPHGDLTQSLIAWLLEEQRRRGPDDPLDLDRIVLLEPHQDDFSVGINVLATGNSCVYTRVSGIIQIFKMWFANSWGNRSGDVIRHGLLTLALAGLPLADLPALLTDDEMRRRIVAGVDNEEIQAYWDLRFDQIPAAQRQVWLDPVLNKWGELVALPGVRCMFGQSDGLDMRQVLDQPGSILLVNCAKGRLLDSSRLVGALVVAMIQGAAMSRADQPERERVPFTLIIDEFQNFVTSDIESILSESRKFKLRLVIAHQFLAQIGDLVPAVFANVASKLVFACSQSDAAIVAKQADNALSVFQLTQQGVGQATLLQRGKPPIALQTLPVLSSEIDEAAVDAFAAELRRRHGVPVAEVQAAMQARRRGVGSYALPSLRDLDEPQPLVLAGLREARHD